MRDPVKRDKVLHYGRKAIVNSIYYNLKSQRICEIEYLDDLFPLYAEVKSDEVVVLDDEEPPPFDLKKGKKKYWVDSEKACPICETPWTILKFGKNVWYDCKPCNKTREQIEKED